MYPVTISAAATALLGLVDWKKVSQSLATDAASKSAKGLMGRLKTDEREKAARQVHGDNFVRMAAVQELARGWKDGPEVIAMLLKGRTES